MSRKMGRILTCLLTTLVWLNVSSSYQGGYEQRGGYRGGRGGGYERGGYRDRGGGGGSGSGGGGSFPNRERFQPGRVLRNWNVVAPANRDAQNAQELQTLLNQLPGPVRMRLESQFRERLMNLNEIYLQLGRWPEAVFADAAGHLYREPLAQINCEANDIQLFSEMFSKTHTGSLLATRRIGIDGTLHRLSLILSHRTGTDGLPPVIGVTARVGRTVEGMLDALAPDLIHSEESLLLIGRPNTGKTTALREFARRLAQNPKNIVVVVDKTCEIGGDGMVPHPAIGNARWLPVESFKKEGQVLNLQHERMREAVENQSPNVVIVDEISSHTEVEALRTMAQRGIRVIATVHGGSLPMLLHDPERAALAGGCHTVLLSGEEANRRRDKQKSVLMRLHEPIFASAVEMHDRNRWILHRSVRHAVDGYFRRQLVLAEELTPGQAKEVVARGKFGEGFEYTDGSRPLPPETDDGLDDSPLAPPAGASGPPGSGPR